VDPQALSARTGAAAVAARAAPGSGAAAGYARDLELLPNTLPPERHRGYALQWFGLAFATLVAALFVTLRPPSK
jgi:cytochrome oxidase assembly protein ShyY1